MEISKINGATRTLGAPANWDHSKTECVGLPVLDFVDENGRAMISAWMPTPEELSRLNAGMPIHLWIYGNAHPVVSLTVGIPADEPGRIGEG